MTEPTLLRTVDARGVATVTLNRPAVHNAFDDALVAALDAALAALEADLAVRVVVLEAAGRSFSAGADLAWMQRVAGYTVAENEADAAGLARTLRRLDGLAKPTVAVVQGAAYGGGVGLVACCDVAVASAAARFCLSEVRLGLAPAVISPYVAAAIGPRQARRYFQTAEAFGADVAREIGLVHEVAPPDGLLPARDRVVAALLAGAPRAQAEAKTLAVAAAAPPDDALVGFTVRLIARLRAAPEGREGLAAFLAKRTPDWGT